MKYHSIVRNFYLLLVGSLLFFTACTGDLITPTDLVLIEDTIPPVIHIMTPENNSYYSSNVLVQGRVTDLADTTNTPGKVDILEYMILGTARRGVVVFDAHGYFNFTFYSGDFEGEKTLVITGIDWNNNKTEQQITLNKGSFRSLTCIPGNKTISLDWDRSPLISEYTLYYTANGTTPDSLTGTSVPEVTPPYTLKNLTNGLLYSITIRGETGQEVDDWSSVVRTIPLSPFTLAPRVHGEYKEISVSWNSIPGADSYWVLRSLSKSGHYTQLSGLHTTTSFIDTDILPGQTYFYKIKPAIATAIESEPACGESFIYPPFGSYIGSYNTKDFAYSVDVQGSYAYVADRNNGLVIINVSDPASPYQTGHYSTPGYAYDVKVRGTCAYIAADGAGLCIVDISTPAAPSLLSVFPVTGYASAVAIDDKYAYVTVKDFGLSIIDISDPASPQEAGSYALDESPLGITIADTFAYVAGGEAGLMVIDISDPTKPGSAGTFDTPHMARDVAVAGTIACVADDASGIQILDISDPDDIAFLGSCDTPGSGGARSVAISTIYAYVANDNGGVLFINIENPEHPVLVESYTSVSSAKGIFVKDEYAYVAAYDAGFYILSAAEPSGLSYDSPIDTSSEIKGIEVDGSYAYVAASGQGLLVYSLNPGTTPVLAGSYTTAGVVWQVLVCGNFAFLTGYNAGLEIVDISDPAACEYVASCDIPDSTLSAALSGDYIYVSYRLSSGESGVVQYDISDPWNPEFINSCATNKSAKEIAISGDYLYVADEDEGICIINKNSLVQASSYATTGKAAGVTIRNSLVCIADGFAGVQVAEISGSELPSFLGAYDTPGFSYGTEMCGGYLFVADGLYGLTILDFHQPGTLIKAGEYHPAGTVEEIQSVIVRGRYGYMTRGNSVCILDLWPYPGL
ncbi:MAG: hypothetical protein JXJ04_07035 [Spirochaetales bacterium]|nr:hypothetical protein [Spirochaetales bacterium]